MTRAFGLDISKFQSSADGTKKMDFGKLFSHTEQVSFVMARSGVSYGYTDPLFAFYWGEMRRIGVCRAAYHVIYPSQDVTKQVDHNMRILESVGFDADHERTVLDLELDQGVAKQRMTEQVSAYLEQMRGHTGRYPILYSRANWLDTYLYFTQLPAVDLWLAQYRSSVTPPAYNQEAPQPPKLPKGASTWLIHQTGSQMPGAPLGAVSYYMDYNRWNGNHEAVLSYFGGEVEEPEPEEPPVEVETPLYQAQVTTISPNRLRVRKTADGELWPESDWLQSGAVVSVYQESGGWARIGIARWISTQYIERFSIPAPSAGTYYGPVYWQRDPRWGNIKLGTKPDPSSTIANYGCLMVCATIAACHAGHLINPYDLNRWLTANGGYLDGNLFLWDKLTERYPDMVFEGFTWWPTDAIMATKIKAGILPIILVDLDETTPQQEMHWVIGLDVSATEAVIVYDPWYNNIIKLRDRYKTPIVRLGSYRRGD